jgi:hypothetical protein
MHGVWSMVRGGALMATSTSQGVVGSTVTCAGRCRSLRHRGVEGPNTKPGVCCSRLRPLPALEGRSIGGRWRIHGPARAAMGVVRSSGAGVVHLPGARVSERVALGVGRHTRLGGVCRSRSAPNGVGRTCRRWSLLLAALEPRGLTGGVDGVRRWAFSESMRPKSALEVAAFVRFAGRRWSRGVQVSPAALVGRTCIFSRSAFDGRSCACRVGEANEVLAGVDGCGSLPALGEACSSTRWGSAPSRSTTATKPAWMPRCESRRGVGRSEPSGRFGNLRVMVPR